MIKSDHRLNPSCLDLVVCSRCASPLRSNAAKAMPLMEKAALLTLIGLPRKYWL